MQLTLIRHTTLNVAQGICYGQSDIDVSHNFNHEATCVKSQLVQKKFDKVYCSPLIRCQRLAACCGYNNPEVDKRLREINFGDWEQKKWNEINDPQLDKWYIDWINEAPTNGESFIQMVQRVKEFLLEIHNSEFENIAIFTHAGVIRIIETLVKGLALENALSIPVTYGQITTLGTKKCLN